MCDPVSATLAIASTAASAAGKVISASEANANAKRMAQARNDAALAEVGRQSQYQQQAQPIQDNLVKDLSADTQKKNLAESQMSRAVASKNAVSSSDYAPSAGSTSVVGSEIARQMSKAVRSAQGVAGAQGNYAAYGDAGQKAGLAFDQGSRQLNTTNNFSRASMNLLPFDQAAAANNAYKAPSGWGGGLSALGTLLGFASMFNPVGAPAEALKAPGDVFSGAAARTKLANTNAFLGV